MAVKGWGPDLRQMKSTDHRRQMVLENRKMQVTGIHHVTLIVDDTERAAWFYGEVLGLEEKGRPSFAFPGLFYYADSEHRQEVHLIVASRKLSHDDV